MPYTDYNQVLQELADNIREVNGTTDPIRFVDMPDLIGGFIGPKISLAETTEAHNFTNWMFRAAPYIDTSGMTDMHNMFYPGSNGFSVYFPYDHFDLSHFDTSNVTNMHEMLRGTTVASINVSNWDTSKVRDMSGMFMDITYEDIDSDLDLSHFDMSRVNTMNMMFCRYGAYSVTAGKRYSVELDVTGWDVSNVIYFEQCFSSPQASAYNRSTVTELDLSGWDTSSATKMHNMFGGLQLRKLWVPSTFVATGCPVDSKPFDTATGVRCHVYTDASSASAQGWGTIDSAFVVHYNSTHADYENA